MILTKLLSRIFTPSELTRCEWLEPGSNTICSIIIHLSGKLASVNIMASVFAPNKDATCRSAFEKAVLLYVPACFQHLRFPAGLVTTL